MEFPERVIIDSETVYLYISFGIVFGYQGSQHNRVYKIGHRYQLNETIHDHECLMNDCKCGGIHVQEDDTNEWWGI